MVKLIYQNEFAGGHLIKNEADSLKRLEEECLALSRHSSNSCNALLFEDIGNGLCRLNLLPLKNTGIKLKTVNRFFFNTANSAAGSIQSFERKLNDFKKCCMDGLLPYSPDEVNEYLEKYKNEGYPPVSHSERYRQAYSPAYRIVRAEYMEYFEVFRRIDALFEIKETVNVAIDGNSGGGKTTLALLISGVYDSNVFHMDDFFLRPAQRTEERLREVGGNVDYARFKDEVLSKLCTGKEFQYRVFDCSKMDFGETVTVLPKRLNIIEGSYSLHPLLIDYYDLKIFMGIDEKKQSQRILKRNGESLYKRFINEWIPMENRYFKEMNIREKCDLVFEVR